MDREPHVQSVDRTESRTCVLTGIPWPPQNAETAVFEEKAAIKLAEKAALRARMEALSSELSTLQRSVMGESLALPSVDSIHHVEVTASHPNGAFVALPGFGSGFIHSTQCSRRIVRLKRRNAERENEPLYAIVGDRPWTTYPLVQEPATLMDGSRVVESMLPVGRKAWAAVISVEGGQVHLSMRDVDQNSGQALDYLPALPVVGQTVRGVVAHTSASNDWAILELPDFQGADEPTAGGSCSGFLHSRDTHLRGYSVQLGDVLCVRVSAMPPPDASSPTAGEDAPRVRIKLQAGGRAGGRAGGSSAHANSRGSKKAGSSLSSVLSKRQQKKQRKLLSLLGGGGSPLVLASPSAGLSGDGLLNHKTGKAKRGGQEATLAELCSAAAGSSQRTNLPLHGGGISKSISKKQRRKQSKQALGRAVGGGRKAGGKSGGEEAAMMAGTGGSAGAMLDFWGYTSKQAPSFPQYDSEDEEEEKEGNEEEEEELQYDAFEGFHDDTPDDWWESTPRGEPPRTLLPKSPSP